MRFAILVAVVNIYSYGDRVEHETIESSGLVVTLSCYCAQTTVLKVKQQVPTAPRNMFIKKDKQTQIKLF